MKFIVTRNLKLNKYVYNIDINKDYYAEVNYTLGVWLKKIRILDQNGHSVYVFKQTNLLLKLISVVLSLITPICLEPVYKFYDKEVYKGKSSLQVFNPKNTICINGYKYELYLHNDNYISIMKNDIQVGLIKKDIETVAEKNRYEVVFNNNKENDVLLLFLLIVFVDIVFFPNRLRLAYYRREKTVGIDKLEYRTLWTPGNMVDGQDS